MLRTRTPALSHMSLRLRVAAAIRADTGGDAGLVALGIGQRTHHDGAIAWLTTRPPAATAAATRIRPHVDVGSVILQVEVWRPGVRWWSRRRPAGPTANQATRKARRRRGPELGGGGAPPGTRTPNRCLKSAKQTGSGPAPPHRTWPFTRAFAGRDYPLLTAGDRQSVPPMCPSSTSGGRTSQAPRCHIHACA
jgi:hypothetical protein